MYCHALSGSRKMNRHWQSCSGSERGGHGPGPNVPIEKYENLILFEKELDPHTTEWPVGEKYPPYYVTISDVEIDNYLSYDYYKGSNIMVRNTMGFQPVSIMKPGNYQLHWNLHTRKIEYFNDNGVMKWKVLSGNIDSKFGIVGALMYGLAQKIYVYTSKPQYKYETAARPAGIKYYAGEVSDYIADKGDSVFSGVSSYINDDIVEYVNPIRTTTKTGVFGANSLKLKSNDEVPPIIFHIGDKKPYHNYVLQVDRNNDVYFTADGNLSSPAIRIIFVNNGATEQNGIVLGKIWLERIGDYTPTIDRWLPRVYEVPSGYNILGDGGII